MNSGPIGILLNQNRCAYSHALEDAFDQVATRHGVELVYLPVEWAMSTQEVDVAQLEELLQRSRELRGLVMVSSVFSHGLKSLAKFAQSWWPRPAASIGYRLPLVPSVLVDNRGAMQAATQHLISDHGRRSILFIRGRMDSQEANDRYFGFRQALTENHIINESSRVLKGDFTRASAAKALNELPQRVHFDAVIAANDEMALAAIAELERSNVRIPQEVSVIGFDDIPAAAKARTPLTSMAQPFDALASGAIELVIEQCLGRDVAQLKDVSVTFVARSSCGCRAKASYSSSIRTGGPKL